MKIHTGLKPLVKVERCAPQYRVTLQGANNKIVAVMHFFDDPRIEKKGYKTALPESLYPAQRTAAFNHELKHHDAPDDARISESPLPQISAIEYRAEWWEIEA